MKISEEITYNLLCTLDGETWFQVGKELKSPRAILGALKKTAYPPDFSAYKAYKFQKHTHTVLTEDIDFKIQ